MWIENNIAVYYFDIMLAARSDTTEKVEEEDLFTGLSFPDVPSSEIIVSTSCNSESVKAVPAVTESKRLESVKPIHTRAEPLSDNECVDETYAQNPPTGTITEVQPADIQSRWSNLHMDAGESTAVVSKYPSLPGEVPKFSIKTQTAVNCEPSVATEIKNLQGSEHTPLLLGSSSCSTASELSAIPSAPPMSQIGHEGSIEHGLSSLQYAVQPPSSSSVSMDTSSSKTDKYVCCGQCRQWLKVPVEVQMVHCPSCDAVNNCNLPPATASGQQRSQTRSADNNRPALNSYGYSIASWFSFCFENISTDFRDLYQSITGTEIRTRSSLHAQSGTPRFHGQPPR